MWLAETANAVSHLRQGYAHNDHISPIGHSGRYRSAGDAQKINSTRTTSRYCASPLLLNFHFRIISLDDIQSGH